MLKGWAWGMQLRIGQEPGPFPNISLQLPARHICRGVPETLPAQVLGLSESPFAGQSQTLIILIAYPPN